ncbi:hypothetical protein C3489_04125 [Streptomyces sp. Ru71]|uniref:hypothetical protein n=1 Tax=Streptomyces sp. Ru71 TaxID=2080746 RepID=UPI000CDD8677|nr:hypothetical protein [Streptomyces sp. Ru71]POX56590.1 hypothetical protein C3489_04125 [Streptomyces sp. Ru71]
MSADEVRTESAAAHDRTGPRHAAPRKPLFTRFHLPAGKAIAVAAMPTAVLMAMGMTPTLAVADDHAPTATSKLADDYQDCVDALGKDGEDASATPSPSASQSDEAKDGSKDDASPEPSATGSPDASDGPSSSPDSGSGDKAEPSPSASSASPKSGGSTGSTGSTSSTPTPSPSATDKNLLDGIGDAITGIFGGGDKNSPTPTAGSTPTASPSASATGTVDKVTGTVKDTTDKVTGTVEDTTDKATDTVKDTTDNVTGTVKDTTDAVGEAADAATATPSPSASATPDDCVAATEDEGGVDNKVPVAEDPWYLQASSLLLKSADYQGVVEVKTSSGKTKKVLKYVISGGTDIGDLHQIVKDKNSGKTYHVQAAKGSTSTIRNGSTVMYTESISGNLFGLIPITFSPDSPPPLNIPLIYFTNVKVTQAAQFGGTLHVPGMHLYTD